MKLTNPATCALLEYASENNYMVELRSYCAVVDGFHGNQVFIVHELPLPLIYNGKFETECLITPEDFKRLFAKR
ncbi:TPA: hypothetical protein P5S08_003731 [Salmonella enterica subsp. enterica serovar Concord]|nr:hypothetical protein [Salmonella enterica subsp. enterica serovar Concord]